MIRDFTRLAFSRSTDYGFSMTALRQPNFMTIADYLAGEEVSGVKHEYQ